MIHASGVGDAAGRLEGDKLVNWVLRNWLIVAASLVALTVLSSLLAGKNLYAGALLLEVGLGIAAAVAVVDGVSRVLGRPSLLGAEQGAGRLLALAQILLGLLLLIRVLSVAIAS